MQVPLTPRPGAKQHLAHLAKNSPGLHVLFILIIEFISYRHLFSIFFLSDDFELLQRNLQWIDPGKGFFRPLPKLIMVSLHSIVGTHVFAFHLISFFIHFANALLIYIILRKITRSGPAALFGSAVFAGNYMSSEAVYWVSSINAILVTLFILLGIHSFLNYLSSAKPAYKRQSLVFLILGLLSNENAVMLPIFLVILLACYSKLEKKIGLAGGFHDLAGHFIVLVAYFLVKMPSLASNFREHTLSIGYHVLRNLRFLLLSLFTFNPFNDLPFVSLDTKLLNLFVKNPVQSPALNFGSLHFHFPLLLGTILLAFFVYIIFKGQPRLRYAFLAIIASTLPVIMLSSTHVPFGGFFRYPLRTFYLPGSLFAIFVSIVLSQSLLWLRKKRPLRKYSVLLVVLIFSLLLSETIKTNGRSSDWLKASAIARSMLGQFGKIIDSSPGTRRMVLFHVPDNYHGAYIFRNGIAAAIRLYFPAATTRIEVSKTTPEDIHEFRNREKGALLLDCAEGELTPIQG